MTATTYLAPGVVGTVGDFTGDGRTDIVTGGPALFVNITG
jgi:hypothetical protein